MKRKFKFLLSTLSLIVILGGGTIIKSSALESNINIVPRNAIQQTEDGYSVDLRKVDITIDEIHEMMMDEYYQTLFPDAWNEFSNEEKVFFAKTPYPKPEEDSEKATITFSVNTSISKVSGSTPTLKGTTKTTRLLGNDNFKSVKHSVVLVDDTGGTWAGHISTGNDISKYNTTLTKPALQKGYLYRFESVHTVTMPSGYSPSQHIKSTQSYWSPCV